ncbi:HD-GYP domain-containing protein [Glaciecola sp. 2405UD65-10]|uniref:HD-GYP domain-containing protein n=1 Tax=Glaciecola sp. 2405UD65-10 TaxID=3397244 RepID=UPI003B5CA80A
MNNTHYVKHLAKINETNAVSVSENIQNKNGALVAAAGTRLCHETARKIAKHKLLKPIDESLGLSYSLTKSSVYKMYEDRLIKKGLLEESKKNGLFQLASEIMSQLSKYKLIQDKLTVFSSIYPDRFERLLTTGVLAANLALELGLTLQQAKDVFLANMISDIGLLHLSPDIVNNEDKLSHDDLKLFHGHVVVSAHFASLIPGLPTIVKRAVLEHHERADGFGYPFGKSSDKLCVEGQIISIAERLTKFHTKLLAERKFSIQIIFAILRVPTSAHLPQVHNALLRIMKKGELPYEPAFSTNELRGLVNKCCEKLARLNLWFDMFSDIYKQHHDKLTDSVRFKPWALLKQVKYNIDETGVLNSTQKEWLDNIKESLCEEHCAELEEFYLLLGEVEAQCFFVLRKLYEEKDEITKLFDGIDLPEIYYTGLHSILYTPQNKDASSLAAQSSY